MDAVSQAGRCIYTQPTSLCRGDSELNDEHYLPRGLGNFRNYRPLNDIICERCNERSVWRQLYLPLDDNYICRSSPGLIIGLFDLRFCSLSV